MARSCLQLCLCLGGLSTWSMWLELDLARLIRCQADLIRMPGTICGGQVLKCVVHVFGSSS